MNPDLPSILENAPDIVYSLDPQGLILSVNQAVSPILGYQPHELIGTSAFELVHSEDRPQVMASFAEALSAGDEGVRMVEFRMLTKSGEVRHFEVNRRILFAEGRPLRSEGIARDVSERKRLEEQLRLYREVITYSQDPIAILDAQGRYLEQNPAFLRLTGYSAAELRGQTPALFIGEERAAQVVRLLQEQGSFFGEVVCCTREGKIVPVEVSVSPLRAEGRGACCYVGFARDVSQRKRQEARRRVMQQMREAVLKMQGVEDIEEVVVAIGAGLDQLSIPYQNCGINVLDLSADPPIMRSRSATRDGRWLISDTAAAVNTVIRMWQAGQPTYRPDLEAEDLFGERRYLQRHSRIRAVVDVPFSQGTLAVNSTLPEAFAPEDIALLQELAEGLSEAFRRCDDLQQLALSQESYRTLVETPEFIVMLLTTNGHYTYVSPQIREWLGYAPEEFYQDTELFQRIVHPEHLALVNGAFGRAAGGQVVRRVEYRWRDRGGNYRWAEQELFPIRDQGGEVRAVQAVVQDITEKLKTLEELARANREVIRAQTQLMQAEKMAALGKLVAGIAHEINTPLGAIHSMQDTLVRAVERLRTAVERDFPACREHPSMQQAFQVLQDAHRVIETGTRRVTDIVRGLRNFARLDEADRKEADLHACLEDALLLIHHDLKNRVQVVKEYGELPLVLCYPGRLNQVFLNLLNNAQQAIEGEGCITISTRCQDGEVHIAIRDSGAGIPPEDLPRIFDPGFTTKGVGVGTGLGLSICYQIVQDHGGHIEVESQLGKGSLFTVVLPTGSWP
ncbi:MAG: PAS domain S-box protein [Candidatus Latescibacteria bacterium]|nr:PAS domain S-box protein [Candidatus Latescibacterota bacterium]